jgi:hypothetical protein
MDVECLQIEIGSVMKSEGDIKGELRIMPDRQMVLFLQMEADAPPERVKEEMNRLGQAVRTVRSGRSQAVRELHLLLISKVEISDRERAWIYPEIRSNLPEECRFLDMHLEIMVLPERCGTAAGRKKIADYVHRLSMAVPFDSIGHILTSGDPDITSYLQSECAKQLERRYTALFTDQAAFRAVRSSSF